MKQQLILEKEKGNAPDKIKSNQARHCAPDPSFCSSLHYVQISAIKKIPQKAGSGKLACLLLIPRIITSQTIGKIILNFTEQLVHHLVFGNGGGVRLVN